MGGGSGVVVEGAGRAAGGETCEEVAAALAQRPGVPVTLAGVPIETIDAAQPVIRRVPARIRELAPPDASAMSAAPFVWRDGRPDWGAMWTTFCDLALHGGPPQRGAEQALRVPGPGEATAGSTPETLAGPARGIQESTGLSAEPAGPGRRGGRCAGARRGAWP